VTEVQQYLDTWITACRNNGLTEKVKNLFLLADYSKCGGSEPYYSKHASRAIEIIDAMNPDVPGVNCIIENLRPIIETYV
jgi:hypothetical protein